MAIISSIYSIVDTISSYFSKQGTGSTFDTFLALFFQTNVPSRPLSTDEEARFRARLKNTYKVDATLNYHMCNTRLSSWERAHEKMKNKLNALPITFSSPNLKTLATTSGSLNAVREKQKLSISKEVLGKQIQALKMRIEQLNPKKETRISSSSTVKEKFIPSTQCSLRVNRRKDKKSKNMIT